MRLVGLSSYSSQWLLQLTIEAEPQGRGVDLRNARTRTDLLNNTRSNREIKVKLLFSDIRSWGSLIRRDNFINEDASSFLRKKRWKFTSGRQNDATLDPWS